MSLSRELRLVWTTERPADNDRLTSPPFFLKNQRCHLTLSCSSSSDSSNYTFCLLIETDREDQSNYHFCVSLEHGNVTGLSKNGVFGHRHPTPQTIWEKTSREIATAFPHFFISSWTVSFKFVLSFVSTTPGDDGEAVEPTLSCDESEISEMFTHASFYLPCFESLSDDLSKFLDEDSRQDVELKCGDQVVKAHGNFLGARSRVFAAMLRSDMTEGRTGLVEIRDMEPELFRCFIRYLYTGKLPSLTIEKARRLYEAGDKFEVEGLTRRCSHFLKLNLAPANACDLLVLADAHCDMNLKEGVLSYILGNKIPLQNDIYLPFCNNHPKLSNEVLLRFCEMQNRILQSKEKLNL